MMILWSSGALRLLVMEACRSRENTFFFVIYQWMRASCNMCADCCFPRCSYAEELFVDRIRRDYSTLVVEAATLPDQFWPDVRGLDALSWRSGRQSIPVVSALRRSVRGQFTDRFRRFRHFIVRMKSVLCSRSRQMIRVCSNCSARPKGCSDGVRSLEAAAFHTDARRTVKPACIRRRTDSGAAPCAACCSHPRVDSR